MKHAYERFLQYARIHTASSEESSSVPTTERQFVLANLLAEELKSIGVADAAVDECCYVYGSLPATKGYESAPKLGFIAHMDTAPDFSGEGVCPQILPNYDGEDVPLGNGERSLTNARFPHLKTLKGRTLIVTDGTTLLGADDKAGIAEIITALEYMISNGLPHGKLSVCFTPDEEVGSGADHFDLTRFDCDFAYTCDGGPENEIEYENFNAAEAIFTTHGVNVHPGEAKNIMVNALLLAIECNAMLPSAETPALTEGYEGFFHLMKLNGTVETARAEYIVRDHSFESFSARLDTLRHIEKTMNERYGDGAVELSVREQYRNMKEKIEPCFHLIENAKLAMERAGLVPKIVPIRGGTDGARLSYMGLPCPNLGTGGYAYHGPYEHITAEGMDAAVQVLLNLVDLYKDA